MHYPSSFCNGMGKNENNNLELNATQNIIRTVAGDALDQILGGGRDTNEPLFVLDSTRTTKGYNVRPIFLYPSHCGS